MRSPLRPELTALDALALLVGGMASAQDVRVTVAECSSLTGPYFEEANPGSDIQIEVVP